MAEVYTLVSIPGTQRATQALFTNALYTVTRHLSRGAFQPRPTAGLTEHTVPSAAFLFAQHSALKGR